MQKWEYEHLEHRVNDGGEVENLLDALNNRGEEGWEVVNFIERKGDDEGGAVCVCILKRPFVATPERQKKGSVSII